MAVVMAWWVKRAAFSRLLKIADGLATPPMGAELLVSSSDRPVQVSPYLPAEPDRICVFGAPLSSSRREASGERSNAGGLIASIQVEVVRLEVRVRVYEPGEDFDTVDRTLGDMCSAVASALLAAPLFDQGRMYLSGVSQDPTALNSNPEPSVIGNASLTFTAEVVTF